MDYIIVDCPHCFESIFIYKKDLNCKIFRHAIKKSNLEQIHAHSSKEICDDLFEKKLIYGCSKPFRITDENEAITCEYI